MQTREENKILAEFDYKPAKLDKGYTNKTLYVNISDKRIYEKNVTDLMKNIFIGGRGFGLWYLWNAVKPETKWNDPENEIIISPGPICGITTYPGSGKSLVVSLSPMTGVVIDSNVGGYFGPFLKFSGFDALELQGKSDKEVIIYIDGVNGKITIEEAENEPSDTHVLVDLLVDRYSESEEEKKNISVVSAGTAAENTLIGCLNFSFYDQNRKQNRLKQAGRGGIGTVLRDKKIKALVIRSKNFKGDANNPFDRAILSKVGIKLHKEIHDNDESQCNMRKYGTANLVKIMNDYDLLPVHNFKFGAHSDFKNITGEEFYRAYLGKNKPDGCWYGCTLACAHVMEGFVLQTGPYRGQKVIVDGPEYETVAGVGSNPGIFDMHAIGEINFYCDTYGIDTISFGTLLAFVMECYENGIINKEITGGLELKFGNKEAALELLHQMSKGEGFGKIAGQGVRKMKEIFAKEYKADTGFLSDIGMEVKGLEYSQYVSKESLAQQGGYALANKGPQHDEAWLIFMDMVNNQIPTFEDKAEALHYFPLFRTWFGLNGLCKLPWNDISPVTNAQTDEPAKVPEHVQNYCDLFYGVTGKKIDKYQLIEMSEKVYNFQRVFNLRMGYGTKKYDMPPYRSIGPVTKEEYESRQERYDKQLKEILNIDTAGKSTEEKMKILRKYREDQYEKLVEAVYKRRGWDANGIPKPETLKKLGIDFPEVIEIVKSWMQ